MRSPSDFAHEHLIHVLGYMDGWAIWLAAVGAHNINSGGGLHFDTSLMAFEVVAAGAGVALARKSMIERELASKRLVKPFDFALAVDEAFYLVVPEKVVLHRHADHFIRWLVEEAEAERGR